MFKHLTTYFVCNSNLVNGYWITPNRVVLWYSKLYHIYPFFLCMLDAHNDFAVLTRSTEISFLSFIFRYIFMITFTLNKVFYFSQIDVFNACHLFKIFLQSERKAWLYLAQDFRFFISKTFDFSFRKNMVPWKKEVFLENSCS